MDLLTFTVEIVKASAWPVASLTIALIFRQELRALLSRIRKGKVGSAEFEWFELGVKELTAEVSSQELLPLRGGAPVVSLATTNPRAAIIDAWLGVERAAQRVSDMWSKSSPSGPRQASAAIRLVEQHGHLSPGDVVLFNNLRLLRNQAVHDLGFNPPSDSVVLYLQLAQGLEERLTHASVPR